MSKPTRILRQLLRARPGRPDRLQRAVEDELRRGGLFLSDFDPPDGVARETPPSRRPAPPVDPEP